MLACAPHPSIRNCGIPIHQKVALSGKHEFFGEAPPIGDRKGGHAQYPQRGNDDGESQIEQNQHTRSLRIGTRYTYFTPIPQQPIACEEQLMVTPPVEYSTESFIPHPGGSR